MTSRDNKLKPCPFCGGTATLLKGGACTLNPFVYVKCNGCGVTTKEVYIVAEYCANDKAVEVWNRRANTEAQE